LKKERLEQSFLQTSEENKSQSKCHQ